MRKLFAIALVISMAGCAGTVTPKAVMDKQPSFDSSTPSQYPQDSNGFLKFIKGTTGNTLGGLITENAKRRFNMLVREYRIQFKEAYQVDLEQDMGTRTYMDGYGNMVWFMSAESLEYFARLSQWSRDVRDPDSIWMKLKDKVQ